MTAWVDEEFHYTITASTPARRSIAGGNVPSGIGWNADTGTFGGTLHVAGIYTIQLAATNDYGTGTATLTLTVLPSRLPPVLRHATYDLQIDAGRAWGASIVADNNPTRFDATGLPPNTYLDRERGTFGGDAVAPGTYDVIVSASNAHGTAVALLRLIFAPPGTPELPVTRPRITSPLSITAEQGADFTYILSAENSPTSFAATNLPPGLNFNPATATISGRPSVTGRFNLTLRADGPTGFDLRTLALDVRAARPPIHNPPPPTTGVIAELTSPTEILLNWPASPAATYYRVERSVSGGAFAEWGTNTQTRWLDRSLDSDTTYAYRIVAVERTTSGDRVSLVGASNTLTTPRWSATDVGAVAAVGSTSVTPGVLGLRGSGADMWGTADEFHFAYQPWTGDGTLLALMMGVDNVDPWTKAGILFRENLSPGARYVMAYRRPNNTSGMQSRAVAGGETTTQGSGTFSWLKIVRRGNTFEAFESRDAGVWIRLGVVTLDLPPTVYVGAAITSHRDGTLAAAGIANLSISSHWNPSSLPTPTRFAARRLSPNEVELTWDDNSEEDAFMIDFSWTDRNFVYEVTAPNPIFPTTGFLPANTRRYVINDSRGVFFRIHAIAYTQRSRFENSTIGSGFAYAHAPLGANPPPPPPPPPPTTTPPPPITPPPPTTPPSGTWAGTDIGGVGVAGSANEAAGVVTLRASGADIWDNADEFHFRSTTLTGDGELVARVTALGATHGWAKAGLMFRENLTASARHAFLCATPWNRTAFQYRTAVGGSSASSGGSGTSLPQWLRLVRVGNTFTGYESTDGTNWSRVGETTLVLPATLHVGLAATSHSDGVLTTAVFDRISVSGGVTTPPPTTPPPTTTPPTTTPPPTMPAGSWQRADVGAVALAGHATETAGVVTLTGSGADIWDNSDEFGFRHQSLTGDGEIVARVTSLSETHGWAKAGVMIRESLAPGARHAFMCAASANGASLQHRGTTNGPSASTQPSLFTPLPRWLRLLRSGSRLTGYHSADGTNWIEAGTVTLDLPATVHVGLAITSHNDGVLGTATFDQVTVRGSTLPPVTPPPTTPPPVTPPPPASPSPWLESDVGGAAVAGSHEASGNRIVLRGAGSDIWDGSDSFHFLGRSISGDCTVEAQVSSLSADHPWAKAGVMIRESLAPGARNVFACLTAANGVGAQQRATSNGATSFQPGPWGARAPYWLRLVRRGSDISAYVSADGSTWTLVQTFPFASPAPVFVGFAITSHDAANLASATLIDPFIQ